MALFNDVAALMPTLGGHLAGDVDAVDAQAEMMLLPDAEVLAILRESAEVCRQAEQIKLIAAGIVGVRSSRSAGHSGLSQSQGHRSPASLVQEVTGSTKGEAARDVRVGGTMVQGDDSSSDGGSDDGAGEQDADGDESRDQDADAPEAGTDGTTKPKPEPAHWTDPLRAALRKGAISTAQFDAILRGLGEPPLSDAADGVSTREAHEAWMQAAEQLVQEAVERTVEELGASARMIRDLLDPEGAERRFLARYEKRLFRMYRDQEGTRRASIAFDDEGGAFLESLIAAAMRPRRGGPRFVDAEEQARAAELVDDARTNDQLTYDLLIDVIRAGALADAKAVFGTRQAGVRFVQVMDAAGKRAPLAHTEDGLDAIPSSVVDQHICESGTTSVQIDSCGNPLDVGREHRLFTPRQRIALAIRDGGCRWRGCDRPASYCEAHHIDMYSHGGRTDIDRGILLCRFHHMNLHHGGWSISRDGTGTGPGEFVLRHPSGEAFALRPRTALSYAWGGIDPPPKRFRPAA